MITEQGIRGRFRAPVNNIINNPSERGTGAAPDGESPYGISDIDITVLKSTGSTNDEARRYAEGRGTESARALIVSDGQTAGRGRRGRSFISLTGRGVYMSLLLLRPEILPTDAPLITAYAATVVREAIFELTALDAKIKWVNDITVGDRKLAGILTEGALSPSGGYEYCIVGIGINTHGLDFPPEIADIATSLEREGRLVDREALIARITELFFERLDTVGTPALVEEYRRHSSVIGRELTVITPEGSYSATAVGIGERCELLVEHGGMRETLLSAEVSIRPKGV